MTPVMRFPQALLALVVPLSVLAAQDAPRPRVIVLGFDGMDPALVQGRFASRLPTLNRLLEASGGGEIATTTPAESPVAWATLITGLDPGEHRIFDFLYHQRPQAGGGEYRPHYALAEPGTTVLLGHLGRLLVALGIGGVAGLLGLLLALWRRRRPLRHRLVLVPAAGVLTAGLAWGLLWSWLPLELPTARERVVGETFWETAARAGWRCRVLTVPMTFPARHGESALLAGLGVPDIRGTSGTFHAWSTRQDGEAHLEFGGVLRPLRLPPQGRWATLSVSGPMDFTRPGSGERVGSQFQVEQRGPEQLALRVAGAPELVLQVGEWSPQLTLSFAITPLLTVRGLGRFHLTAPAPGELCLYLAPLSFDPRHVPPTVGISWPRSYARELAEATGPYKTLGWAVDTWAVTEGVLGDQELREDLEFTFDQRRARLELELSRPEEWDLLVAVFEATDRASHLFMRHIDPAHPAHDSDQARLHGEALLDTYRWADEVVAQVLAQFGDDPSTLVLVLSDHGFASFRRGVNLNTWLEQRGYLALRPEAGRGGEKRLEELFAGGSFYEAVDWSHTRAFAMGLGAIYLNRLGVDPRGVVLPTEVAPLAEQLAAELLALVDPGHPGAPVVASVALGHEVYQGRFLDEAPELMVGFAPGYRVSWQTALGGMPAEVFEDNLSPWSGDHCSVAPGSIPGLVAATHPLRSDDRHLRDVAPTVLSWLGVAVPGGRQGRSLLR